MTEENEYTRMGRPITDIDRAFNVQVRGVDKFLKVPYFTEKTGAPILKDCLAYLDCRVIDQMDSGDHTIFLGEVLSGRVIAPGRGLQFELKDYLNASASSDGP